MSQAGSTESLSKPGNQGVGASLRRNEDARYLDGKGEYLADLQVPGMAEVFFLRSPVAHGKIRSITVPEAARDQVFFASDIAFTKPILAVSAAKGFKPSNYPALTSDKARFVGDLLAICIAPTRAEAEDIAQSCIIDFDELPAVWDIDVALERDAPRIHESWSDNVYIETRIATGDLRRVNTHRLDLFRAPPDDSASRDAPPAGREASPVGRPDFKSGRGRETVPGGFDSLSLPPPPRSAR